MDSSNASGSVRFKKLQELTQKAITANNIIDIRFTSTQVTLAVFDAEILLEADTQSTAVGKITYEINDAEVTDYHPTETWIDGKHVLRLLYFITITSARSFKFVVKLNMAGGSASIPKENIKAAIHGQGLLEVGEWNGIIECYDTLNKLTFTSPTVKTNITETITPELETVQSASGTDELDVMLLTFSRLHIKNPFSRVRASRTFSLVIP